MAPNSKKPGYYRSGSFDNSDYNDQGKKRSSSFEVSPEFNDDSPLKQQANKDSKKGLDPPKIT